MDPARLPRYSLCATIPAPCRDVRTACLPRRVALPVCVPRTGRRRRQVEHRLAQALDPSEGGVLDDGFGEGPSHRYAPTFSLQCLRTSASQVSYQYHVFAI